MTPGQHSLEPFLPDRSLGTLRDTILILLPGPKVLPVALHRADLEGTIVDCVLRSGHGALNIDACRIRHSSPEDLERHKTMVARLKANGGSLGGSWKNSSDLSGASEVSTAGRWPPNVILVHGPGCRQVGTKTVKGSGSAAGYPNGPKGNKGRIAFHDSGPNADAWARTPRTGLGTEDGKEEVPAWDCQPDCPVRILDEQTGDRPGMPLTTGRQGDSQKGYGGSLKADPDSHGYGDSGSASRFFPTFPDLPSAERWLQILIGQS